jgi:hypothetical protein
LAAAYRKVSRHATVAWCKGIVVRKNWSRTKVERATRRVGPLRKNLRMHHEGKRGTKDLGSKQQLLYLRKKRATAIDIGEWSSGQLSPVGRGGPFYKTSRKTLQLEFVKQANGMPRRLRKVRNRTLWKGRALWSKKTRIRLCGGVDPFRNKKRNCTQSRSR